MAVDDHELKLRPFMNKCHFTSTAFVTAEEVSSFVLNVYCPNSKGIAFMGPPFLEAKIKLKKKISDTWLLKSSPYHDCKYLLEISYKNAGIVSFESQEAVPIEPFNGHVSNE